MSSTQKRGRSSGLAAAEEEVVAGVDEPMAGPKSKILIYSHSLPPWVDGVSTRFASHIDLLKRDGHDVHLLTIEKDLDANVKANSTSVSTMTSTAFYWYPAKQFPEMTPRNLYRVWKACRDSKPDVIHATMCPSACMLYICSCLLEIPMLMSIHTDSVTLLNKCNQPWWVVAIPKLFEPLASWVVDATYTVSPSYASILTQRGITALQGLTWGGFPKPVFNLSHREDRAAMESIRQRLSFGHSDQFIMAFAGRISPEKDIDFLLTLLSRFKDRGVWLVLVGSGPANDTYSKLHGEEHHLHFVPGFINHEELALLYSAVDCVTSASTFETFGFTALEAMACGTPVLVPRAQGFRDVVTHNKGGYLFDAKDLSSASHYLELLLSQKAELFPPEGVFEATAAFTPENCFRRTLAAYDCAKANRRNSGSNVVSRTLIRTMRLLSALIVILTMFPVYVLNFCAITYGACVSKAGKTAKTA